MDYYQSLALLGGALLTVGGIPQVVRLYKLKSANDVSLSMFVLVIMGQMSFIVYGLHINDIAVMLTNFFTGILSLTIILLILKYRHGKS